MPTLPALSAALSRFQTALLQPQEAQRAVLRDIVQSGGGSLFGRRHGFSRIGGYEDFARAVPVSDYEGLRSLIDRAAAGEAGVLTVENPVCFEETGGSTGGAKLVPYTESLYAAFRRAVLPWLADVWRRRPAAFAGRLFFIVSPAARGRTHTAGGIPIGSGSDLDYFGRETAAALLPRVLFLPELLSAQSTQEWQLACARLLLGAADLSFVSVWSPTMLLLFVQTMQTRQDDILATVADPRRRALLSRALSRDTPDTRAIWPRLDTVSCWTSHTAAAPADALRQLFPHVFIEGKGLLATEFAGSIPFAPPGRPSERPSENENGFSDGLPTLLAIDSHFYEFAGADGIVPAWQTRAGGDYRLIVTTQGGLYRYDTGDYVRVHALHGGVPEIEFVGRGSLSSDLCGEKLSEAFVRTAMETVSPDLAQRALLQGVQDNPPYYSLLSADAETVQNHALAARLDEALAANPQYAYARRTGQLAALRLHFCADPQAYAARFFRAEQRFAVRKIPLLLPPAAEGGEAV
ncbi:GH3 auxin-responsive promoter [Neisseria sp. oral taxon 020 str. F0370]|uniref:GH3 family domain-containing protein n=1 Tax=Neisseria sp. oral taxon 020 TaxID=712401 RepID=UPI0002A45393|nr:GH3 auxin-responsive promoter family protein [Neisseria sp. oral taxon 020]EKY04399.1 GH3 auxin-responsive promoter [Neisseria sp. oral taxon 020 str. F0370]